MHRTARRTFAVAAGVVALVATSSSVASAGIPRSPDNQPSIVKDCGYGHQTTSGGLAWAHCSGDTGQFRVMAECHDVFGNAILRYGPWISVPTLQRSEVNCMENETVFTVGSQSRNEPVPPMPPGTRVCKYADLRVPSVREDARVEGADPTGRYQVGTSIDSNDDEHLLRWDNGALTDLGAYWEVRPVDVNAGGQIIGSGSEDGDDDTYGRYVGGEFVELPTPSGYNGARPAAINTAGQVAGLLTRRSGGSVPAVWSADDVITVLEKPAGWSRVSVVDIDENGTVLGNVSSTTGDAEATNPVVWYPDGTWRLLAVPRPDLRPEAVSIRNGRVVGLQDGDVRPGVLQWDALTGEATLLPVTGYPAAINARGAVAGLFMGTWWGGFVPPGADNPRPLQERGKQGEASLVTDGDILFGNTIRPEYGSWMPVRWDCSV